MTREELLKMGGKVITPTIQPKMTREELKPKIGGLAGGIVEFGERMPSPLKIVTNTASDAWNMLKGLTYGTVKNIVSIPKETIGLIKDLGGISKPRVLGKATGLLTKEIVSTGAKMLWNLIPNSAKELANVKAIKDIPKEFQNLAKEAGGYSNALKEFRNAIPSSTPKAFKEYVNQIGEAVLKFADHPLNETLGYLAMKDIATMTPEKLKQRAEFTKQSFKNVISDVSKAKVVPTEVQSMVNTLKTKVTQKAVSNVTEDWNKVFKSTKSGIKKLTKGEITGKDPAKFLAERKITPKVEGTKINPDDAITKIERDLKPLHDMTNKILETRPERISFNSLERQVLSKISTPANRANPDYANMKNSIKNEFNNYRQTYGDSVNLEDLNNIKIAQTKVSGVFDATKPKFQSNVNYQIGKVAKETIVNTVGDDFNMNGLQNLAGDHLNAMKMLESVRGQTVAYGRMGKIMGTAVGFATGKTLIGKISGAVGGNYLVNVLQDITISNPLKSMILQYAQIENPAAYTEALNYLRQQTISQITTKALPPPSYIPMGERTYPLSKAQAISATKLPVSMNPKTGKFQTSWSSTIKK